MGPPAAATGADDPEQGRCRKASGEAGGGRAVAAARGRHPTGTRGCAPSASGARLGTKAGEGVHARRGGSVAGLAGAPGAPARAPRGPGGGAGGDRTPVGAPLPGPGAGGRQREAGPGAGAGPGREAGAGTAAILWTGARGGHRRVASGTGTSGWARGAAGPEDAERWQLAGTAGGRGGWGSAQGPASGAGARWASTCRRSSLLRARGSEAAPQKRQARPGRVVNPGGGGRARTGPVGDAGPATGGGGKGGTPSRLPARSPSASRAGAARQASWTACSM